MVVTDAILPTTFTSFPMNPYSGEWVFSNFLSPMSIRENARWYKISTELSLSLRIFFTLFVPTFAMITRASWWPSIISSQKSSSEKEITGEGFGRGLFEVSGLMLNTSLAYDFLELFERPAEAWPPKMTSMTLSSSRNFSCRVCVSLSAKWTRCPFRSLALIKLLNWEHCSVV